MNQQIDDMSEEEGGFDFREILSSLLRRWRMIIAVTVLITTAAIAYAMTIPNYYTATATVQIDRRDKKIVHIDGVLSDLKADTPTLESEVEVIASPSIAQRVIERLKLRHDPEFSRQSLLDTIPAIEAIDPPKPAASPPVLEATPDNTIAFSKRDDEPQAGLIRDRIVQNFLAQLQVRRLRNSLIIEVSFTSRDPLKAARIANTVVDIYIERQYREKTRATEIAITLLDQKLSGLRDRLSASEREISDYKSKNGIIDTKGHGLQEQQLSSELETLLTARNQTAQARSRYEQARRLASSGVAPESIVEIVQNDTVRILRTSLSSALRRHAELATRYGPLHPEMRKVEADLAKARQELRDELSKAVQKFKVELDVSADREAQLQQRFDSIKSRTETTKAGKWRLHELEREAKATQQLFEVLLSRKKQAQETLGMHFPDAKYVAAAEVPLMASYPKRKNIIFIAFAAGLALALGLAILLDQISGGITDAEKIEREFRLPHLASIPNLQRKADGFQTPLQSVRMMLSNPNGIYAESIREVQYELDWRHHHQGSRIILVTSALTAEGKTLLASNLAHNLAMSGRRTLLIDADMRKHSLTRILKAHGNSGLFEALCKGHPVNAAILHDELTGLSFMPAAADTTRSAPPAEILASRHTQALLSRLKSAFDVIVIDAPPLLPVIDARILASQADQIVLNMNWHSTPKRSVHRALRSIARHIPKVAGIVLNGTDPADIKSRLSYRVHDHQPALVAPPRKAA